MSSKLTPFGLDCRQLRRSHDKLMADQAKEFAITVSFISKMENGLKPIPEGYVDRFSAWLGLNIHERERLAEAAVESAKVVKLEPQTRPQAQLAVAMSRKIGTLTPAKIKQLREILNGEKTHA